MTRLVQIFYYSIVIISLTLVCSCMKEGENKRITKEEAESFMSSYVSTLKSGDTEAIKEYWSNKSLNRRGSDVMHLWIRGLIHISEWKSFLDSTQYTYHIKKLLKAKTICLF